MFAKPSHARRRRSPDCGDRRDLKLWREAASGLCVQQSRCHPRLRGAFTMESAAGRDLFRKGRIGSGARVDGGRPGDDLRGRTPHAGAVDPKTAGLLETFSHTLWAEKQVRE
jgi:hypothetical protein